MRAPRLRRRGRAARVPRPRGAAQRTTLAQVLPLPARRNPAGIEMVERGAARRLADGIGAVLRSTSAPGPAGDVGSEGGPSARPGGGGTVWG